MFKSSYESLHQIAEKFRSQLISPLELVENCFANIEKYENIHAWCYLDKKGALEEANQLTKELENNQIRGPLHGIPIGVKDNIDVKGMPTRMGSRLEESTPAKDDAPIIKTLRELGAIIIGKTHMTEYAWLDPGPTKNPYNLLHTPGGSSSGSAAAAAAKMVPIAIGSQTAASVTRPASYCGAAAFKPTYKKNNLDIHPLAPSFDTIGFFAHDFDTISYLMQALGQSNSILPPSKIGIIEDPLYQDASSIFIELQQKIIRNFQQKNIECVIVKPVVSFQDLIEAHKTVMAYEAADYYQALTDKHASQLSSKFTDLIYKGVAISHKEYIQMSKFIEQSKRIFWKDHEQIDMFVTIPTSSSAPKGLESTGDPSFTIPWTVLGGPLSVLPGGFDNQGLPVGIMLATAPGRDRDLLSYSNFTNKMSTIDYIPSI